MKDCSHRATLSEDSFLDIAVRSFLGAAADICGAAPENTLLLTDDFRQRYLRGDLGLANRHPSKN